MTSLSRILEFGEEKMAIQKAMTNSKKMKNATEEECFFVYKGPKLQNLQELAGALGDLTEEQFEYHTQRDGSDFARWIENVFGEKELAKKISKLKSKSGMKRTIEKFLKA